MKDILIERHKCFECGSHENIHNHHVIPQVLGGKKTIPLCNDCHGKLHGKKFGVHKNPNDWRRLIKIGREKYVANGGKLGRRTGSIESTDTFLSKPKTKEIIKLINDGKSVRDISGRLGVSTKTIVKVRKYWEKPIKEYVEGLEKEPLVSSSEFVDLMSN